MKKIVFSINLFVLFLLIGKIATAQDVITVTELSEKMKDKNTVVVACVKPEDYAKTHIKDAIHILHKDLYKTSGPEGILKPSADIAKLLGSKGLSNTNLIVLYDDGEGKYAGRMYWILKYLGCKDVKILDGHIKAWKSARKPVTATATVGKKVTFTATPNSALLATMSDVQAGNAVLVDARSAAEFNGTDDSKLARKGHIPGAINFEFKQVLTDGKLKSKSELEGLFKKAGMTKDKNIILYCETSVRAGIIFFALSECGYTKVKVYDGAFNEWIATPANKVDK